MTEHPFVVAMREGDLEAATEAARISAPLHDLMDLRITEHRPGDSAVVTMELNEAVRGSLEQPVHGGILATLADVTSAWALSGSYSQGRPVTTDLHMRYYRQPRSGPITATATVVHNGRRLLSVECAVADAEDRVLTRSTATYMIVPGVT
jgi:uncharacterized protein (TIGR00369 family)